MPTRFASPSDPLFWYWNNAQTCADAAAARKWQVVADAAVIRYAQCAQLLTSGQLSAFRVRYWFWGHAGWLFWPMVVTTIMLVLIVLYELPAVSMV